MKRRWSPVLAFLVATALPLAGARLSSAQPRKPPTAASASASSSSSATPPAPTPPGSASAAPAVTSVPAEILVLHANNSGGGIDPKIRDLPQLKKPPFSSYNTYKVLSQQQVTLALGRPSETTLPNNGAFRLTYKELPAPGHFKLAATILQPGGKPFLPMLEVTLPQREYFFIGAQSHTDGKQEGKLVLAVKILR